MANEININAGATSIAPVAATPSQTKAKLLRSKILTKQDIKKEVVHIDEWDLDVLIKGLTGKERNKLFGNTGGKIDMDRVYPELIILVTLDPETEEPIFNDTDKTLINDKACGAQEKIFQTAMKLSGLAPAQLEEIRKN